MAGHSKWANIKHKKEAKDAQRSNIFAKMSRLVTTAVQEGGGIGDPEKNLKLRLAVERARSFNMPKDTIQRAIDKGLGTGALQMKELVYEGFGPGGSALMITAITDKSTRTISEIKQILDKNGGKIASPNAVSHLFVQCGYVEIARMAMTEEQAYDLFDTLEGIDMEEDDEAYIFFIPFAQAGKVQQVLRSAGIQSAPRVLDIIYKPLSPIEIDATMMEKVEHLVDKLENNDDVQNVYTNVYTAVI